MNHFKSHKIEASIYVEIRILHSWKNNLHLPKIQAQSNLDKKYRTIF
jgi:hypothetical protein